MARFKSAKEGKWCHYYITCGCVITPLAREMLTFPIYYQPFIMSSERSLSGRCGREYRQCGGTRGFWCSYTTWGRCFDLISPVNTSKPPDSVQEFLEGFQLLMVSLSGAPQFLLTSGEFFSCHGRVIPPAPPSGSNFHGMTDKMNFVLHKQPDAASKVQFMSS